MAIFPWAMLVGQRFYGEPEHEVRAWNDGRLICSRNLETGGDAGGADRVRRSPSSSRCANRCCSIDAPGNAGQGRCCSGR